MQCVCVCVSVNVSACVFMYMRALVYSQAIAIAVCEGGLGKLHYSSTAFPDDFRSATQKFLGLRERLSQLFLPLHKLWVTLRTYTQKKKKRHQLVSFISSTALKHTTARGRTSHCSTNCFPPLMRSRIHFLSLICVSSTVTICSIVSRFCCKDN